MIMSDITTVNEKNVADEIIISDEQYDALAVEFLPAIIAFYESERGKRLFQNYLDDKKNKECSAA